MLLLGAQCLNGVKPGSAKAVESVEEVGQCERGVRCCVEAAESLWFPTPRSNPYRFACGLSWWRISAVTVVELMG